jgi:RecA-family ATPase
MSAATTRETAASSDTAHFLRLLAEEESITFQTFDDSTAERGALAHILHGRFDEVQGRLSELNALGAGVFWTVNATDLQGRRAENIIAVRAVFVDLDGAPLGPVENCSVEPQAIVESSPGRFHAYWLVADCPPDKFRAVQRALAAKFDGDASVTDLPRVMRLPGFEHRKGDRFVTRLLRATPALAYRLDDLVQRLGLDLSEPVRAAAPAGGLPDERIPPGGRHKHLERTFGILNVRGLAPESIEAAMQAENQIRCNPPLERDDVAATARAMTRRYAGENGSQAPPSDEVIDVAACYISQARRRADTILRQAEAVRETRGALAAKGWTLPDPISDDEMREAKLHPPWIVENYLAEDVAILIAQGGAGKSTLLLYEAAHIVLGLPLYGRRVLTPGPVLILTREDGREQFVARLREVMRGMKLDADQRRCVMQGVIISDLVGEPFKLATIENDMPVPSSRVDELIAEIKAAGPERAPRLIAIDPAVSFGVGESRVNDAEQALVEAARRLRSALGCCVRYVHHTGKANAREKTMDQYSGRNGSAFPDGSRMVAVLRSLDAAEWRSAVGEDLAPGESGLVLALPKLSFSKPQENIYIRRSDDWAFHFTRPAATAPGGEAKVRRQADQVWRLLQSEVEAGRFPTRNSIEAMDHGMTRGELRQAVAWLLSELRLDERSIPGAGRGGARKYLHPSTPTPFTSRIDVGEANENGEEWPLCLADPSSEFASPPP